MHRNNGNCDKCKEILKDCTSAIKEWFTLAQAKLPELHASHGYRGDAEQNSSFRNGLSHARFGQSPHNYKPAPACDVWFFIDGKYNADIKRYRDLASQLPEGLESGLNFKGLVDANHIQEKDWKSKVKNYPNGNT